MHSASEALAGTVRERENKTSAVRHTRALIYEVNGALVSAEKVLIVQYIEPNNHDNFQGKRRTFRGCKHGKTHVVGADLNF